MNKQVYIQALKKYVSSVNKALLARASLAPEQLSALRAQGAELLHAAERMHQRQAKGAHAHAVAAAKRRSNQPFTLAWRSTGKVERVTGWQALAARTGLQPSSLRVLLSQGRGSLTRQMVNERGDPDVAEIKRL